MLKALIFDFDGLILDTETPVYESWREVFEAHGAALPLPEWAKLIGRAAFADPRYTVSHYLEERLGRPVAHQAVHAARRAKVETMLARAEPYPGVRELIAEAEQAGLRIAVASSSAREWVTRYLKLLGIDTRFPLICCGDDRSIAAVKPASDLYLAALDGLGVSAAEAVALENSPVGIAAAKAAGIFCVAVPNDITGHCPTGLDAGDIRLESLAGVSLRELREWLSAGKAAIQQRGK